MKRIPVALIFCVPAVCLLGPGNTEGATCLPALAPARYGGAAHCMAPRPATPDFFDTVLAKAGLTRCDLTFPQARMERILRQTPAHDRFRLPFFDTVHEAPLRLPAFARETIRWLDDAMASGAPTSRAIQVAAQRLGYDLGEVCPFDPPAPHPAPLAAAVIHLISAAGVTPEVAAITADVPLPLQEVVAKILTGAEEVERARRVALEKVASEVRPLLFQVGPSLLGMPGREIPADLEAGYWGAVAGDTFDYKALYTAAARLARTIELSGLPQLARIATRPFSQPTPWGQIIIGGPGDDVYDPVARPELDVDLLLFVDTGGNDVYKIPVGANRSIHNPVSLAFDLAGDDTYDYVEAAHPLDGGASSRSASDVDGRDPNGGTRSDRARQGAGRLGIGFLYHFGGGKATYHSLRLSQGYGQFGVGVLYDDGGDDTYRAEALAQGSALFGIGLLLDKSGNDRYLSYAFSQGFGYAKGAGILVDGTGNDHYEVNHGDPDLGGEPLYPSPQAPGHANTSMSQGFGLGKRPSPSSDLSASGGLGVLRDRGAGDDVYIASIFAQGSGYWFGTGMLQDGGGNDIYDGFWYVQGAAAHMAMAWFADEGGNDRYNQTLTPKATSIGVGHDLGVAMHLDLGGHDAYRGAGLTFGAGSDQGMGIFINIGGDDVYDGPAGLGFGSTSADALTGPRATEPTFGFFVHVAGRARYRSPDKPTGVRNNATWIGNSNPRPTGAAVKGAGGDDGAGTVSLP